MSKSLQQVKKRLRAHYLKREWGIHGFGISIAEQVIKVYLDPQDEIKQKALLERIEQEAAPYRVIAIFEERPSLSQESAPNPKQ